MTDSPLETLKSAVNENAWITDISEMQPYATEWRNTFDGIPLVVLFPESTNQVSEIVKICASKKIAIIPQGGNTGLCGGAIPDKSGSQSIVLQKASF